MEVKRVGLLYSFFNCNRTNRASVHLALLGQGGGNVGHRVGSCGLFIGLLDGGVYSFRVGTRRLVTLLVFGKDGFNVYNGGRLVLKKVLDYKDCTLQDTIYRVLITGLVRLTI